MKSSDVRFLDEAVALSFKGMKKGDGGPFGSVVVRGGKIISRAWNEVLKTNDPTAHAEVLAIRRAAGKLKRYDLSDCAIYASCEPCPMCLASIYWARIPRVVYANRKQDAARIGFVDDFIYRELDRPASRRSLCMEHRLHADAKRAFKEWAGKPDKRAY